MSLLPLQSVHADIDRTHPPMAGPLPEVRFPEVTTETLSNGLRVFILPTHKQPLVTFRLLFKAGDSQDGAQPGLSDLTAALLNKGSGSLNAAEFAKKTDFQAISIEAASGPDSIVVAGRGLSRDSAAILGFLRDAALHPAFQAEEIEKERAKMIAGLAQKKMDPEELTLRMRGKLLYGQDPYGEFASVQSVRGITREDIVKFHGQYYNLRNATLAVVGDIEPEAALRQIKETLGAEKSEAAMASETATFPAFPTVEGVTVHVVDRPGSVQSNIVVARRGVARNNPDLPSLGVVSTVLGGGMSGRLFTNLREQHGYTYGAYCSFSSLKRGGTFSASAQVRNEVTGAAVKEILYELKRISAEPIPEEEFNLQRNFLVGNFLMSVEKDDRTAERQQEIDLYGLPADYYKTYVSKLTALTPAQAQELAQRYLNASVLDIIVVGEAKEIVAQLEPFGKVTVYDMNLKEKK